MSEEYNQEMIRTWRKFEANVPGTLQEQFLGSLEDIAEDQTPRVERKRIAMARHAAYPLTAMALDLADITSLASKY